MDARLDALETRLDSVETRLDAIEGRLDRLEAGVEGHDRRLDRLEALHYDMRRELKSEFTVVRNRSMASHSGWNRSNNEVTARHAVVHESATGHCY